jgi:hypothetical protein
MTPTQQSNNRYDSGSRRLLGPPLKDTVRFNRYLDIETASLAGRQGAELPNKQQGTKQKGGVFKLLFSMTKSPKKASKKVVLLVDARAKEEVKEPVVEAPPPEPEPVVVVDERKEAVDAFAGEAPRQLCCAEPAQRLC